jgi:hypothetical protein
MPALLRVVGNGRVASYAPVGLAGRDGPERAIPTPPAVGAVPRSRSMHSPLGLSVLALLCLFPCLAAAVVDPTALGRIQHGMSEHDVLQHLGAPDAIHDAKPLIRVRKSRDGHVEGFTVIRRVLWGYAGDQQTLPAMIEFENGHVVNTWKGR